MDGNEHNYPVPQNMPQAPLGAPGIAAVPGYVSQNPLQPGPTPTPAVTPDYAAYGAAGANQAPMVPPSVFPVMTGIPGTPGVSAVPSQPLDVPMLPQRGAVQPEAAAVNDDNSVAVDDVVWVNRAKKAILESQGDPHRQVQLIQHLRSVYLKQRFGRDIHTDDD